MTLRKTLRRWHVWLGWLVGVPLLFWTLSGLIMVLKPIEEVRGEHLVREAAPIMLEADPVPPRVGGLAVDSLSLQQRASGPVWIVSLEGGETRMADPATGDLLPAYGADEAAAEVAAAYVGDADVVRVEDVDTENPPLDWRRSTPAWMVLFDDGTRFYVEKNSGRIAARRTDWWRIYDWFWGLHIMDLETREMSDNWILKIFAAISLISILMALLLMPLATWRKRSKAEKPS